VLSSFFYFFAELAPAILDAGSFSCHTMPLGFCELEVSKRTLHVKGGVLLDPLLRLLTFVVWYASSKYHPFAMARP